VNLLAAGGEYYPKNSTELNQKLFLSVQIYVILNGYRIDNFRQLINDTKVPEKMKLTAVVLSCAGFLMLHVPAASAEDMDPALSSNGAGCVTSTWCASVNLNATDPISGDTGLVEYILNTSGSGSDPSVVAGDVDMSDGWVIRFEMSTGAAGQPPAGTPQIFIINNNNHLLAAYDPSADYSETAAADDHFSNPWTPTSTQAGYDSVANSSDTYGFELVAPEPASIFLLSAGLGLLGFGARKRMRTN
jgi:hypothetical protein